ncbi:MAG TPA: M1 family aminopeptidase, partial [Alphaproteobacteria bacterium]
MRTDTPPKAIYLKDYTPPHWRAEHVDLSFRIFEEKTLVRAITKYRKNHKGNSPLILNGEHLKLLSVKIGGKTPDHEVDDKSLTIHALPGDEFTLEIETEIDPASNTRLEGLYKSGGNWCTQCEAEGFRTITYYVDRPDNMATFRVRVEGNKAACPVLLSNGNLIEEGSAPDGRHFTVWDDPTPKPCYLFALVAGKLEYVQDHFKTRSGLDVDLRIYVRDGDQKQCAHAMDSLKRCMRWDEDVYGREYQYTRFNIVAVSDFNMGAMENKSLNIFNTAYVLADQNTATDADFDNIARVVAHEYFHNWSGDRVTCRDWFQLSLKEGFT